MSWAAGALDAGRRREHPVTARCLSAQCPGVEHDWNPTGGGGGGIHVCPGETTKAGEADA